MRAVRKDDLVYLTPHAEEELQQLDPDKAYIIGGIVDRNRHKNICQEKATAQVSSYHACAPIYVHPSIDARRLVTVGT